MPHLIVNRRRMYNLLNENSNLKAQFFWEAINAVAYKVGGVIFIIGSICFLPRFEAYMDLGAILFVIGSIIYLIVSIHDIFEVNNYAKHNTIDKEHKLELLSASTYLIGSILFTIGSILFLKSINMPYLGAWNFIIGSFLFVIGSLSISLRVIDEKNRTTMQLTNLTAISFVVGSVLFLFASVPYLWDIDSHRDGVQLFRFLAWQYIIGSILFLFGGLTNYCRAYFVIQQFSKKLMGNK